MYHKISKRELNILTYSSKKKEVRRPITDLKGLFVINLLPNFFHNVGTFPFFGNNNIGSVGKISHWIEIQVLIFAREKEYIIIGAHIYFK